MSQNLVSITITPEQQATILAAIAQIEASLPGLISLPPAKRKKLTFMGSKSVDFVRTVLRVIAQNLGLMPRNFDIAAAEADLAAHDALMLDIEQMRRLLSRMEDTALALGADLMFAARNGYKQLQISGDDHGLGELTKEIGERFAKGGKKSGSKAKDDPASEE